MTLIFPRTFNKNRFYRNTESQIYCLGEDKGRDDFYVFEANRQCPNGTYITDAETCKRAAGVLGYVFGGVQSKWWQPKGCMLYPPWKKMYLNTHVIGSKDAVHIPICRKGDFFYILA